jgi:hypothetical protein
MITEDSKTPFSFSKFPWANKIISPKINENFDKRSQKGSPTLF